MTSSRLRMQHSSLQYSDTPKQQEIDIRDLFERGTGYPIKTGTEAAIDKGSPSMNYENLVKYAREYDHILKVARDNWVAIDRKIVVPASAVKSEVFLVSNDDMIGPGHDRVLAAIEFDHVNPGIGHISVGAIHYATKGRVPGDPNYDINKVSARKLNAWMKKEGAGTNLSFLNGDFNMLDNRENQDWAFGGDFTSMADELKAWENTGHGPIDGFCSYDADGRVKAHRFDVLTDKEFPQHSDHYVCRGVWEIRHLKTA